MDNLRLCDWHAANAIIEAALREWFPSLSPDQANRYAVAIQARLASAEPPLSVCGIAWAYQGKPS